MNDGVGGDMKRMSTTSKREPRVAPPARVGGMSCNGSGHGSRCEDDAVTV